jgi:hypothetical protein
MVYEILIFFLFSLYINCIFYRWVIWPKVRGEAVTMKKSVSFRIPQYHGFYDTHLCSKLWGIQISNLIEADRAYSWWDLLMGSFFALKSAGGWRE